LGILLATSSTPPQPGSSALVESVVKKRSLIPALAQRQQLAD